jgi:hypothetical protein
MDPGAIEIDGWKRAFGKPICQNTFDDQHISRPSRKSPEAAGALKAFTAELRIRETEVEQVAERLRAERDKAIRTAYDAGVTMREIARVMTMSHQRVSQIVRSHER